MAEQGAEALWKVLTDYALGRWVEPGRPTRERVRAAFDWIVPRIHAGRDMGPGVVAHNGDAVYRTAFRLGARVALLCDVYHPTRTISVLEFKSL